MRTTTANPRRRAAAAALCLAVVVPACTGEDEQSAPTTAALTTTTVATRQDDGRLVLGVFLPRTGPGASLGEPMFAAVQQAVDAINAAGGVLGQAVRIESVDENAGGGGMAQLVELGVDAIVGPASSTVALDQLDDAVQPGTGVVICSPSATALALDDYPDNKLFFRTVASDSLQMAAIADRVSTTGVGAVSLAYLDDLYGRGLHDAFASEAEELAFDINPAVPFSPDQEDLSDQAAQLLAGDPRVVVVLGGPDDTTRLLAAMDVATANRTPPTVIVNEAVRDGRQAIPALTERFRTAIIGVAPLAKPTRPAEGGNPGFFTANAVDCVNLIALAAVQAGSDAPERIQTTMAAVSREGAVCNSFADCVDQLDQKLQIDYNGVSGPADLSTTTGDLASSWFEVFAFDATGADIVPDDALFAVP